MELTAPRQTGLHPLRLFGLAALLAALLLSGCGTGRRLPPYEPPLARTDFQTVRTTAFTHTEADHLAYGNRNAIGGTLRSASIPDVTLSASSVAVAPPFDTLSPGSEMDDGLRYGFQNLPPIRPRANVPIQSGSAQRAPGAVAYPAPFGGSTVYPAPLVDLHRPGRLSAYGSAAADWSRWPVGTVFQVASTGQVYQVDDYGWALAGRNTIDLYQPSHAAMNAWGVRREPIHVLHWGSREESLRRLRGRQKHRHVQRMVLELEGKSRAAARLK